MVIDKFIHILKNSDEIIDHNALDFKNILEEYPYFQSARTLYIKALKNQESFKYNFELKKAAAYTTDRNILFNFITAKKLKKTSTPLTKIPKTEKENGIIKDDKTSNSSISTIIKPKEVEEIEKDGITTIEEVKEKLDIGKPINFLETEAYSFNQWMQLASKKTIDRKPKEDKPQETNKNKSEKEIIVDNFIITKPKITPLEKATSSKSSFKPLQLQKTKANEVMTETLAKVYLEQKKYESAKKAYEILSLKYPEKSGFFADQIKRIQTIQKNK